MQRPTQHVNKTDWFFLSRSLTKLNARLAIRQRADLFVSGAVVVFFFLFFFSVTLALRKANFVSRNIGLKKISPLPYGQSCIQFVTTTHLPYSDCSKILDGANIPADKSLFSGVVRNSLDDFYDRKREVKKVLQKMKQRVLFQTIFRLARTTFFRFTDVTSFGSKTRDSRSKLFSLSDCLLEKNTGILFHCEKNELSGARVNTWTGP